MANNNAIFNAVLSGATGAFQQRWITSPNSAQYASFADIANSVATAVDSLIPAGSIDNGQRNLMQGIAQGVFADRWPQGVTDYSLIASAIVALYTAVATKLTPEGGGGGGAVDSVFSRTGVVVAENDDYNIQQIDGGTLTNNQVPQWSGLVFVGLTPADGPVNPTDNGKIPRALNGNFSYVGGSAANQVLWWNNVSLQFEPASIPQLDGIALTPVSGAVASTGDIRGGEGFNVVLQDSSAVDRQVMLWDAVSRQINLGSTGASATRLQAVSTITSVINGQTRLVLGNASLLGFGSLTEIGFDNAVVNPNFDIQPTANAVGTVLGLRGQNSTTGTGGAVDVSSGTGPTAAGEVSLSAGATKRIRVDNNGIGFYNTAGQAKPTITGSRAGNAALADLLTKLATLGLLTDSTTA